MFENGKTQFLEVEGARLAYDVNVQLDDSSLLVCVNGFQRSRLDFRAFRNRLRQHFPSCATVAIDNCGIGETEITARSALTIELMAEDVQMVVDHVLKKLSFDHYFLMGISMGGMISQACAAKDNKVTKLILISTSAGGKERVLPNGKVGSREIPENYGGWPLEEEALFKKMKPYFGQKFLEKSPLLVKTMVKNMLRYYHEKSEEGGSASQMQYTAVRDFDGTLLLPKIKVPTLIVSGDEDAVIPPQNSEYLAKHLAQGRISLYPQAGHLLLIEEPEKLVQEISQFLQQG